MRAGRHTTTTPIDAVIVTTVCFGFPILLSIRAVLMGFPELPFSDSGFVGLMAIEVVLALVALTFLYSRQFDIQTLIPEPTLWGTAAGVGLFLGAWVLGIMVTAPFANAQSEQFVSNIMGNSQVSVPVLVALGMVNGAFEEVFLLGVLVRGLRAHGLSVAIGVPLLVRVLYHLYQGPLGALWILAFGLLFSLYYVRFVALWPPVLAHALWDIVPFIDGLA